MNFGRVPGEKGVWAVPYITNMAMRVVGADGQLLPAIREQQAAARAGGAGARGGGGGGGRGGSKSEPWMPWMPWSAAVYDYNSKNESKYDPEGYCLPPGGPRMMATPYQMEIIQQPEHKRIMMIFEGATHIWREIYMDGRAFPEGDALNPTYLGYSVGQWEGDTLVVENKGFNENSWLDYFGHPHTDQMHVIERWTRPNKGTLHYEATVTDAGAYTRPFTMAWDIPWRDGRRAARVHLPGEQPVPESPGRRSRSADLWPASAAGTEAVERYSLGGMVRPSRLLYVLALSLLLVAPGGVSAQFGHPLKGQWSGQWGPADSPKRLLLDLHWDGKEITGVVNPGDEKAARSSR